MQQNLIRKSLFALSILASIFFSTSSLANLYEGYSHEIPSWYLEDAGDDYFGGLEIDIGVEKAYILQNWQLSNIEE